MLNYKLLRKAYYFSIKKLHKKAKTGHKIKVCFAVVFNNVFPMAPVFEKMLGDALFDPFLAVIPDTSRGFKHQITEFIKTTTFMQQRYPDAKIETTYEQINKNYIDIAEKCDLYCTANPYDAMTLPIYGIDYFWKKHIPVFYTNYFVNTSASIQQSLSQAAHIGKIWRLYAANNYDIKELTANPYCPDVVLSGYPRFDSLAKAAINRERKKTILITPDFVLATARNPSNPGTFLKYADLYNRLPGLYPDLDFIIRPHPLLFTTLENDDIWGEQKSDEYWRRLGSLPNVEIQRTGEYFEAFMNSDAIINDCITFTVSYLFTGKPCCRLGTNKESLETNCNELGKKCLDAHYLAFNENDIIEFIDKVILNNQDSKFQARKRIFEEIAVNYPNASEFIINDLKDQILKQN